MISSLSGALAVMVVRSQKQQLKSGDVGRIPPSLDACPSSGVAKAPSELETRVRACVVTLLHQPSEISRHMRLYVYLFILSYGMEPAG
jgi:hypothetical protein